MFTPSPDYNSFKLLRYHTQVLERYMTTIIRKKKKKSYVSKKDKWSVHSMYSQEVYKTIHFLPNPFQMSVSCVLFIIY